MYDKLVPLSDKCKSFGKISKKSLKWRGYWGLWGVMGWGGVCRVQVGGSVGVMWRVMWLVHRLHAQVTRRRRVRLPCPSTLWQSLLSGCG